MSEKKLRDALLDIQKLVLSHTSLDIDLFVREVVYARAEEVLRQAGDKTEMEQLLEWIQEGPMPLVRGHLRTMDMSIDEAQEDKAWNEGELNAYDTVIAYIEEEFGYEVQ